MSVLCTHPGRYGDLLWALPTMRALADHTGTRVDLLLPRRYASESLIQLLQRQPYLGGVFTTADWEVLETAPISPRIPPNVTPGYDQVVHLGLDGWPQRSLPFETYRLAALQVPDLLPPDLTTPWITAPYHLPAPRIALGFTDEYFELKYGLYWLLRAAFADTDNPDRTGHELINVSNSPRWNDVLVKPDDWQSAAAWIGSAKLFIGCCSALHVLACALGTPVLVLEPQKARHHDCFYPYGKLGPQVTLVTGNDGLPTFDARHLIDLARMRLEVAA